MHRMPPTSLALVALLTTLCLATNADADAGPEGGNDTNGGFRPPTGSTTRPSAAPRARLARKQSLPGVSPTPQSVLLREGRVPIPSRVTLVATAAADPVAVATVSRALRTAGATSIQIVRRAPRPAAEGLTVFVGRNREAEESLRVNGSAALAKGGYVLAAGGGPGDATFIVLDGVDSTGEFYAAQTLRQLLAQRGDLPSLVVRDWPTLPVRGVVEGFYGPPWSQSERLSMIDFLGAHKLNAYMYAPKDDPYHRAEWRQPYPRANLAALTTLTGRATANHVVLTFAVSPGLSICYSSPGDQQALLAKLDAGWKAGARSFAVAFDDVDPDRAPCDSDRTQFGTGRAALGHAQADLLNRVRSEFIEPHAGAAPLITVPTEYKGLDATPYKGALAGALARDVVVQWTGRYGISIDIRADDAARADSIFPQPLLIWDNFFVNDYCPGFLALGPFDRHEPAVAQHVLGLTADPLQQAESAKIGLFTVADWSWNPAAYDPRRSWSASLTEFADADPAAVAALRAVADANYSPLLNPLQSPALAVAIGTFWQAWKARKDGATTRLAGVLTELRDAPDVLRRRGVVPAFTVEAAPWLDATEAWARTALTALDLLAARRGGRVAQVAKDEAALVLLERTARSYSSRGTPVVVAAGVLDKFVADARAGAAP